MRKVIILFICILFLSNSPSSYTARSESNNIFPILPSATQMFAGMVGILGDHKNNNIGYLFDENLNELGAYYNLNTDKAIDFSNSIQSNKDYIGDLWINRLNGIDTPRVFCYKDVKYFPKVGYITKNIGDHTEYPKVEIYDVNTGKLVKIVPSIERYISPMLTLLTKDLVVNNGILYNIFTNESYGKFYNYSSYDDEMLVTNEMIFNMKTKKVLCDLTQYQKLGYVNLKKDYIDFYAYKSINDEPDTIITRFSRDGEFLFKQTVPEINNLQYLAVVDSYKNFVVGVDHSSTPISCKIVDIYSGSIVDEIRLDPYERFENIICAGPKCMIVGSLGCRMINMETMTLERFIQYPEYPNIVSDGKRMFVINASIDNDGKLIRSGHLLDDKLKPIANTLTYLPNDAEWLFLDGDEIVAVKTTLDMHQYDSLNLTYYKIGSATPYKQIPIRSVRKYGYTINNGKLYMFPANTKIRLLVFDTQSGKVLGDYYDDLLSKYEDRGGMIVDETDDRIAVAFKGCVVCWDKKDPKKAIISKNSSGDFLKLAKNAIIDRGFIYFFDDNKLIECLVIDVKGEIVYYLPKDGEPIELMNLQTRQVVKKQLKGYWQQYRGLVFDDSFIVGEDFYSTKGDFIQVGYREGMQLVYSNENSLIMTSIYWSQPIAMYFKFDPCPSFAIKRIESKKDKINFSFTNTRQDDLDLVLKGEAYLASWGDDGKPPIFTKLDEPHHKLGPLLPGMTQEITFDLPKPLEIDGKKSEGKYFALIVESNGLLDTKNSELSDFDKEGRPLFDGSPLSLDKQHAIVLTMWKR